MRPPCTNECLRCLHQPYYSGPSWVSCPGPSTAFNHCSTVSWDLFTYTWSRQTFSRCRIDEIGNSQLRTMVQTIPGMFQFPVLIYTLFLCCDMFRSSSNTTGTSMRPHAP